MPLDMEGCEADKVAVAHRSSTVLAAAPKNPFDGFQLDTRVSGWQQIHMPRYLFAPTMKQTYLHQRSQ